jgi:hypothetical protein
MAEKDPIDLIREQLNRVEELAGLHADHELFKQWHTETKTILEKAFSPKSVHTQNFLALRFQEMSVKVFASTEIDKMNAARYKKDLENVKKILQGAIKELTLDRTLFKKLQTTPKKVEVSLQGKYFVSSGISDAEMIKAIESAFDESGLKPIGGSEPTQKGKSLRHRIDRIREARLGIYDLSIPEKDETLIELGVALGMGKEAIILCKKGAPLPEATKHLSKIEYENFSHLVEELRKRAKSL